MKIKSGYIKLMSIEIFLIIISLINIFVINIKNIYIVSSFLLLNNLIIILLLGYEKSRHRLKKDSILNVVIFVILLQLLLYISGIFFGFLKSGYSREIFGIIKNILPIFILIITTEMLRYCINIKGSESKFVLVLSCITFILIEFTVQSFFYNLHNKKDIVEIICFIFIPSITKNIFLTYNTTKFGYESSIIYRVLLELFVYFVPIVPNLNKYLSSIINFLYPVFILVVTKNTIGKINPVNEVVYKKVSKIPLLISIVFLSLIIALNSGIFSLYTLAIGSGSMENTLFRGDAIIVKKVSQSEIKTLKMGDILVYKYQDKTVVHRIYSISYDEHLRIITKGDNNDFPDAWIVDNDRILGTVKYKIKYLGYPTVWLSDFLG